MSVKRKRGDRKDGVWLKDTDVMHMMLPYILPNRCDNEAYMSEEIDLTAVNHYLEKKNCENPEYKYSMFQVIVTAIMKTFMMRPQLNRFIIAKRLYQRNDYSAAFVVKKAFSDEGEEAVAIVNFENDSNIEWFNKKLYDIIYKARNMDEPDEGTKTMEAFMMCPRFILSLVVKYINTLNHFGRVPDSITKGDFSYATCMFTNLGSLGLNSGYHHLFSWGTNSNFVVIGKKKAAYYLNEKGEVDRHETVEMGFTTDERISDGYYYSQSLKLFRYLMNHPEELEKPMTGETEYDWRT
jgi:hypothetical protein